MGSSPTSGTSIPSDVADLKNLAYVIGLAIGDGNLSNPNGRATRLRISCDTNYPILIKRIAKCLQKLLPNNKINTIPKHGRRCIDISVYSNKLEEWLGWKAKSGSKYAQRTRVPQWIQENRDFSIQCLRGLFETDGSVYHDRGYLMTMFVTTIPELSFDVMNIIQALGFRPNVYKIQLESPKLPRYNIRISKDVRKFIETVGIDKS